MKGWNITLLAVLLLALFTIANVGSVAAHGATVSYTATTQTVTVVEIHATFDSGEPMSGAQVAIFSPADPATPWSTGTCDNNGSFSFLPDPAIPGTWEVQVRQSGHGSIVYVEVGGGTDVGQENGPHQTSAAPSTAAAASTISGTSGGYSPLQYVVMGASVVWGLVGTALFFARNQRTQHPEPEPEPEGETHAHC